MMIQLGHCRVKAVVDNTWLYSGKPYLQKQTVHGAHELWSSSRRWADGGKKGNSQKCLSVWTLHSRKGTRFCFLGCLSGRKHPKVSAMLRPYGECSVLSSRAAPLTPVPAGAPSFCVSAPGVGRGGPLYLPPVNRTPSSLQVKPSWAL